VYELPFNLMTLPRMCESAPNPSRQTASLNTAVLVSLFRASEFTD
jgi:hypothetical protein